MSNPTPEDQLAIIASRLHYPQHWDTIAYPTLADAVLEVLPGGCPECSPPECQRCQQLERDNAELREKLTNGADAAIGCEACWQPTARSIRHSQRVTSYTQQVRPIAELFEFRQASRPNFEALLRQRRRSASTMHRPSVCPTSRALADKASPSLRFR